MNFRKLVDRFFAKVEPDFETGCWNWIGSRCGTNREYGQFYAEMWDERLECRTCGCGGYAWQLCFAQHPKRAGIWYCHYCLVKHPALGRYIIGLIRAK